jgi:hypothetical protein
MFGRFKRNSSASGPRPTIRDTLFGDLPLSEWPPADSSGAEHEPWNSFVLAREALAGDRRTEAITLWRQIAGSAGLESRHRLQAWHFLRAYDVQPTEGEAKALLGVVLEVPMHGGVDLLAAYPERTARYYNHSGAGVVWERPDASLDGPIDTLLHAGQRVLNAIGPWREPRLPAPPDGQVRLNFLSPAGLHFGQGAFEVLANDPMASPVINAGTALMQRLIGIGHRPGT